MYLPNLLVCSNLEVLREKIEIFEESEHRQVTRQSAGQQQFSLPRCFGFVQAQTYEEIQEAGRHHQQAITPVPPAVENVAGNHEQNVLRPAVPQAPVERENDEEEDQERQRGERHRASDDTDQACGAARDLK